jgi:hypothetical protein
MLKICCRAGHAVLVFTLVLSGPRAEPSCICTFMLFFGPTNFVPVPSHFRAPLLLAFRDLPFCAHNFLSCSCIYICTYIYCKERIAKTGQPKQDSQNGTSRTGQTEQDRQNRTGISSRRKRTGRQDCHDRAGLPVQDFPHNCQGKAARTELPGQNC